MTFAHWAKTNAVALATWLGVVLSVIATGAANVALAGDKQDMLVAKVEEHDESIVVKVVERTEAILIELDRTTAELKVMVQTIRQ